MNPSLETYIKTLEESNEDLSKRLAVAENYIAWKDSHKRLRFKYALMYHHIDQSGFGGWEGVCITRSKMLEYIFMFKTIGKNALIELIEKTYKNSIDALQLKLKAHHGKERVYDDTQTPIVYKSIIYIRK